MRLLPRSRRGRAAVAVGLAALLAVYRYVFEYRPWEAHYRGRPMTWWAADILRREEIRDVGGGRRVPPPAPHHCLVAVAADRRRDLGPARLRPAPDER